MPGARGEKISGVVSRLLREYESPRFSLHKYGWRVDNREYSLARGENLESAGTRSVIFVSAKRNLLLCPPGLHIVHRVLRYTDAAPVGELLEQPHSDDHLHVESDMGRVVPGRHHM